MTPEQVTHTVTVNAAEQDHRIESVTVFQSTAEIKRRVNLDLKDKIKSILNGYRPASTRTRCEWTGREMLSYLT
ncbi:Protein F37C4,5 [Ceratobasidium theobromae]|uniref:Protein F37C4,5 n=1 Tax=Ceratobasidium theobromae TaxID=1582974 RepID=A0A5N5QBQ6_9AGAM|nr:Protein F37C4,5 [Ceratobasidium theobromae]